MRFASFAERYHAQVVKEVGTLYTRLLNRFVSKYVTYGAYRLGLSPNALTVLSTVAVAAGAASLLVLSDRLAGGVAALVLLQLAYVLDCCDGQLARLTGTASTFGGFLDLVLDRLNNLLVFSGIIAAEVLRSSRDDAASALLPLLAGLVGYVSYTVASMIRGFMFASTKGYSRLLSGVRGLIVRAVYELGDTGWHFLLMSVGYIAGLVEYVALAYGVWGLLMTTATALIARRVANEGG